MTRLQISLPLLFHEFVKVKTHLALFSEISNPHQIERQEIYKVKDNGHKLEVGSSMLEDIRGSPALMSLADSLTPDKGDTVTNS